MIWDTVLNFRDIDFFKEKKMELWEKNNNKQTRIQR